MRLLRPALMAAAVAAAITSTGVGGSPPDGVTSAPPMAAISYAGSFGVVPPTDPDEPSGQVGARADQEADKRAAAEEARLVEERRESALRAAAGAGQEDGAER